MNDPGLVAEEMFQKMLNILGGDILELQTDLIGLAHSQPPDPTDLTMKIQVVMGFGQREVYLDRCVYRHKIRALDLEAA